MTDQKLPAALMDLLNGVTGKRARTLIDHILAHGYATTEELKAVAASQALAAGDH